MGFLDSKKGKNFMAKLYGIGAAVVILGALFKILHWPGADIMLIVGLGTEAIIFFFSAFEKPGKEYDWSLVYPELAGMDVDEEESPARQLDNMMEKAKIDSDLISSLGDGLRKVSTAANGLGEAVSIAESTNKYSQEVNQATSNLASINKLYATQIESNTVHTEATQQMATNMKSAMQTSQDMQNELERLTKNLSSLNSVYGNMLTAMNINNK
ncbi:MAG: gliding motility protein GldL [Flavobacteriales bacterium]